MTPRRAVNSREEDGRQIEVVRARDEPVGAAVNEEGSTDVVMTPTRALAVDLTSPEADAQQAEPATPVGVVAETPVVDVESAESAEPRPQIEMSSTPVPVTPTRAHASPRYQHGRGLSEMDLARPSSANSSRSTPAGISTVAYDRFKKRPSFRSPDWARRRPNKRLAFLESQVQLAQEEHERADEAERSRNAGRRHNEANSQNLYGRRTYVLTGSDALQVANSAVREFLHDYPQESAVANRGVTPLDAVENSPRVPTTPSQIQSQLRPRVPTVDEAVQVDLVQPERRPKRTVLLVDSTTQTSPPPRPATTPVRGGPATPRTPSSIHRLRRPAPTTPQAFNPVLMNQRYPPEPLVFSAQTSYNQEFSGHRRASR